MEPRDRYAPLTQHEVNQAVYRLSPAGTQEVADLVGVSHEVADRRLRRLKDEGTIWAKKVGPTMVWMHPRVIEDPDPERDTCAEDIVPCIFGDIYRASRSQPPHGNFPHRKRFAPVDW